MEIAQLHFLVAEGDTQQRQELTATLLAMGAGSVSDAPDGQTALRNLQGGIGVPVDVGLIDLSLPGMDALELIRHLADTMCRVSIIVTGAHSDSVLFSVETMAQAYGVNMLGTVAKPVSAAALEQIFAHFETLEDAVKTRETAPRFTFEEVGAGLQSRQFEPFFQPKIELRTGDVKGVEMFARWLHPRHGPLGPASFITALRLNDRVDFLDGIMIDKSVAACRQLHDQGIPLSMSINVSPRTLAQPSFLAQMNACLQRHDILAEYITFEMPESSVLANEPHFLESLLRLRMRGFGLAIDDYGTGRSNLQLLARIPFSELKIDRSFVDGAAKKRAIGTVLGSCLGLARSLERSSCAVGVETRADWDFLQGLGCTYAQGYYIAKAMPVAELPGWLSDWHQYF